ncbi:hypothetical protein CLOM_g1573 [Closterium sp. NIES-68]|nr:hypothetical protein CLOM_g1573 [Closterium sp. NIES-68]GJP85974.1 hypothetical protein CLOP_g16056 [Closterium sp. NIES-67]
MGRKGGGSVKAAKGGKALKIRGVKGGEYGDGERSSGTGEGSNTEAGGKHGKGKGGKGNTGGRKGKGNRGTYKGGGGGAWEQLRALGLCIREVSADGNCFFRAVSDHVFGNQSQHVELRHQVVDYLEAHEADFAPFVEDDMGFKEYCSGMRDDGTWGGHMELQAVSLLLKRNICIHQFQQPRWNIVNFDEASTPSIHLSYHDGDHYNSVRLEGDAGSTPAQPITIQSSGDKNQYPQEGAPTAAAATSSASSSVGEEVVKLVMASTGCHDRQRVVQALDDLSGDVDAAIEYLIAVLANETSPHHDPELATSRCPGSAQGAAANGSDVAHLSADLADRDAPHSQLSAAPGSAQAAAASGPDAAPAAAAPLGAPDAAVAGREFPSAERKERNECSERSDCQQEPSAARAGALAATATTDAAVKSGYDDMPACAVVPADDTPGAHSTVTGALAASARASVKAPASKHVQGRNKPCPCGSKKKFKACCGTGKATTGACVASNSGNADLSKMSNRERKQHLAKVKEAEEIGRVTKGCRNADEIQEGISNMDLGSLCI